MRPRISATSVFCSACGVAEQALGVGVLGLEIGADVGLEQRRVAQHLLPVRVLQPGIVVGDGDAVVGEGMRPARSDGSGRGRAGGFGQIDPRYRRSVWPLYQIECGGFKEGRLHRRLAPSPRLSRREGGVRGSLRGEVRVGLAESPLTRNARGSRVFRPLPARGERRRSLTPPPAHPDTTPRPRARPCRAGSSAR